MVRFQSCEHLIWTVVFLTKDPYSSNASQASRFEDLLFKLNAIPALEASRFKEFRERIVDWGKFQEKEESQDGKKYFLWRRDDANVSDIILRQRILTSENGSRTQVDLNISL